MHPLGNVDGRCLLEQGQVALDQGPVSGSVGSAFPDAGNPPHHSAFERGNNSRAGALGGRAIHVCIPTHPPQMACALISPCGHVELLARDGLSLNVEDILQVISPSGSPLLPTTDQQDCCTTTAYPQRPGICDCHRQHSLPAPATCNLQEPIHSLAVHGFKLFFSSAAFFSAEVRAYKDLYCCRLAGGLHVTACAATATQQRSNTLLLQQEQLTCGHGLPSCSRRSMSLPLVSPSS